MFGLLTKAALIASVVGIACPDNNSSCALLCASPACTGSTNCSTNAACSVTCNNTRACSGIVVSGVSTNSTTEDAVKCEGSYACENAEFTAKPVATTTRFSCSGNYSCASTTFNCASTNCELVCGTDSNSCRDLTAFNCVGGAGKTCNVVCNGGCYPSLNVVCANYPCSLTYSGTNLGGVVAPCSGGQLVCADGSCVAPTATCPSQCIAGDPCNKISSANANKCVDIGIVGNKFNCTCSGAYKPAPLVDGLVQSCNLPLGFGSSITVSTYSTSTCSGLPTRTRTYTTGCSTNSGVTGQSVFSQCTASKWCQKFTFGSCATSTCSLLKLEGTCQNGVRAKCNNINNGAGSISAGATIAIVLLAALF